MNLDQIRTECFILALFIRDDGERFLLGTGAYEFDKNQLQFIANTYANDIVEVQGNDGVFLAGQVRRGATQPFDGYVGNGATPKTKVEEYRREFIKFFRKNYYYKVVYIFSDGSAIQRKKGFIVDAPEVKELYQYAPQYHVALNFEDINYYSYSEDSDGEEIYADEASIPLTASSASGGLVWDEYGVVWDEYGAVWEEGSSGGATIISVDSIDIVYPIWEVRGPAVNPQLTDITTNTTISYDGTVTASQTLTIDMFNKTATLNGTSVISRVSGEWVYLKPGQNRMAYTASNQDAPDSKIRWQEIVG